MISENELQKQIIEKIKAVGLYNLIKNKEVFKRSQVGDSKFFFSINNIIQEKYVDYGEIILKSLDISLEHLEIVNGNSIRNISIDRCEALKPDIILYSQLENKYFLIELKRSSKTEREAITQLLGYRLEMKNHLPLINNGDIPLIIISTEYGDLLRHSIASLVLDNTPVLCLKPIFYDNAFYCFELTDISAWTELKNSNLSATLFAGDTFSFYGKSATTHIFNEEVISDMYTAVDLLKHDANKIGSNGFCIAWKNFEANVIDSPIFTGYFISIFTVNPFGVFYNNLMQKGISDILSNHIKKTIQETDCRAYPSFSDEYMLNNMKRFLNDKYCIMNDLSGDYYLFNKCSLLQEAIFCDSWGEIGDFIRRTYISLVKEGAIERCDEAYKNPFVFFENLLPCIFEEQYEV